MDERGFGAVTRSGPGTPKNDILVALRLPERPALWVVGEYDPLPVGFLEPPPILGPINRPFSLHFLSDSIGNEEDLSLAKRTSRVERTVPSGAFVRDESRIGKVGMPLPLEDSEASAAWPPSDVTRSRRRVAVLPDRVPFTETLSVPVVVVRLSLAGRVAPALGKVAQR
jgi:hypothetical protein